MQSINQKKTDQRFPIYEDSQNYLAAAKQTNETENKLMVHESWIRKRFPQCPISFEKNRRKINAT